MKYAGPGPYSNDCVNATEYPLAGTDTDTDMQEEGVVSDAFSIKILIVVKWLWLVGESVF